MARGCRGGMRVPKGHTGAEGACSIECRMHVRGFKDEVGDGWGDGGRRQKWELGAVRGGGNEMGRRRWGVYVCCLARGPEQDVFKKMLVLFYYRRQEDPESSSSVLVGMASKRSRDPGSGGIPGYPIYKTWGARTCVDVYIAAPCRTRHGGRRPVQ